jgi:hypothetical protein
MSGDAAPPLMICPPAITLSRDVSCLEWCGDVPIDAIASWRLSPDFHSSQSL